MYFIYIDDSGEKGLNIYTAIAIPAVYWNDAFKLIRNFRENLKIEYGIPVSKELHSWKLISGRGNLSNRMITKNERVKIFNAALELTTKLPGVQIFPSCNKNDSFCFERLLNRIHTTIKNKNEKALIFSDHGKDNILKKIRRKMGIYNHIPSNRKISEVWRDTGKISKNIPITEIIEDIVYKDSAHCYFIQLADVCAYALLRKEIPLESKNKFGLNKSFTLLDKNNALALKGIVNDVFGIIR